MVEQLGMCGLLAHDAEVIRSRDEACAHEFEPDAVRHDAGGEWIVFGGDPVGEIEAAAALRDVQRLSFRAKDLDEAARDDFAGLFHLTADEDGAVEGLRTVEHAHGECFGRAVFVEEVKIGLHAIGAVKGAADAEKRLRVSSIAALAGAAGLIAQAVRGGEGVIVARLELRDLGGA